jgi:hypothetical protein
MAASPLPRAHVRARAPLVGWSLLFAYLSVLMLAVGMESALHFRGPPIDGPFQLYNALRRISVGQRPGGEFQFFHGIGIPYLHYPLFWVLGANFRASEITRELLSSLLYPASVIFFVKFFVRDWTRTMAWSALVMAASIGLRMTSVLVAINSLLGIRSLLPVLMPVFLCLPIRTVYRRAVVALALGGSLLLGTEQGLAIIFALCVVTVLMIIGSVRRREYAIDAAWMVGGGVAFFMLALLVAGGSIPAMRSIAAYNLKLVPMDQYWYFGAPPNHFAASWGQLPSIFASLWRIPIVAAIGIVVAIDALRRAWKARGATNEAREFAFAVMAVYGVISLASLLGIWVNAYIQPLLRVILLLMAIRLDRASIAAEPERSSAKAGIGRTGVLTAAAAIAWMVIVVPSSVVGLWQTLPHMLVDHIIGGEGMTYSGIWPETIPQSQRILDAHRHPDGKPPTVWSTYAGLLEARNGMFHPSFDYIIHVLGPENRRHYVEEFERLKPDLVQTVSPQFTQYETWIEADSWDFYASLLRHYRVAGTTGWSTFWEPIRDTSAAPRLVWSGDVPTGATHFEIPALNGERGTLSLMQIELDYEIHNPLGKLPVVGATPRYLVSARNAVQRNPISLDPWVTTGRYPLLVPSNTSIALQWGVYGLLPGASVNIKRVRLLQIGVRPDQVSWVEAMTYAQMTQIGQ